MEPLQEFISTFFELTAFMILWSKFNLRRKLNFSIFCKNFVIVVLISIVVVISNDMFGSYYSIAVNYLFMTFLSSFVYKKNIVKNFVQVCTSIMFLMIIELIVMYPLKLIGFDTDTFLFGIVANTFVWIFCIIIYYFIPNSKFEVISKID
ncbi:MAG: hypothetical protein LKK61_13200, partial [Clostridium sp.]|nr:hypothetical protein [Clostridium sp.]